MDQLLFMRLRYGVAFFVVSPSQLPSTHPTLSSEIGYGCALTLPSWWIKGNTDLPRLRKWSSVNSIFSTTNMSSSTLYVGKLLTEKCDGTTA